MLFMPMIAAAALAAVKAGASSRCAASASIARITVALRDAIADARAAPQACRGVRAVLLKTLDRLSLRSLALSGSPAFSVSMDMMRLSSDFILEGAGKKAAYAAFRVSSPFCQLQGQSSSV